MSGFNPYLFFGILVAGLVWIYFQIPRIKKETKPKKQATKEEWQEASNMTKKYAFWIFILGLFCTIELFLLTPYKNIESAAEIMITLFKIAICLSFTSTLVLIFFNHTIKKKYLNN